MANRKKDLSAKFETHNHIYYKNIIIRRHLLKNGKFSYRPDYGKKAIQKRRPSFNSVKKAKRDVDALIFELNRSGTEGKNLSLEQRGDAVSALKLLNKFGVNLVEVANYYAKEHTETDPNKSISYIIDRYLKERLKSLEGGSIRPRTYEDTIRRLNLLRKKFGDYSINDVTDENLKDLLAQFEPQNRANYKRYISMFFLWAVRRKIISESPAEHLDPVRLDDNSPEIYSPEQTKRIMNACSNPDSPRTEMIPYFSLAFFGGVRPEEIFRLSWEDVDLENKIILIRASVSKTRKERRFAMTDNLYEWLQSYPNKTGKIFPYSKSSLQRWKSQIYKTANSPSIQDGARHSMATYYYAMNGLENTIELLGHSDKIMFRHYKSMTLGNNAQITAEEYFNIRPTEPDTDIIPFDKVPVTISSDQQSERAIG